MIEKELEKKVACYLCRTIDGREYTKMAEWMGKDRRKFNLWVGEMVRTNI